MARDGYAAEAETEEEEEQLAASSSFFSKRREKIREGRQALSNKDNEWELYGYRFFQPIYDTRGRLRYTVCTLIDGLQGPNGLRRLVHENVLSLFSDDLFVKTFG
ncbi:hypothetical protein LXL04_030642 [Taraxacum kok-saghyz]